MVHLLPEQVVVLPCFFGFERLFWSGCVEPGTRRRCIRRSLAWVESGTATGNPGFWISVAVKALMKNLG